MIKYLNTRGKILLEEKEYQVFLNSNKPTSENEDIIWLGEY